jgi:hypothetical protein
LGFGQHLEGEWKSEILAREISEFTRENLLGYSQRVLITTNGQDTTFLEIGVKI